MTSPEQMPFDAAKEALGRDLATRLAREDFDHLEIAAGDDVRLRVDVVQSGQLFFWITYIAATESQFEVAAGARAAMRSFPWTMPFKPKLELSHAALPVLCRWQRAYVDDTAALCVTLLSKHFRVPLDEVQSSGEAGADEAQVEAVPPPAGAARQQKVWLGEVTAWFMRARQQGQA